MAFSVTTNFWRRILSHVVGWLVGRSAGLAGLVGLVGFVSHLLNLFISFVSLLVCLFVSLVTHNLW